MKKSLLVSTLILSVTFVQAQVNPHAIGVRLDGSDIFGVEASYQHGLGDKHRLELDGGFGSGGAFTRAYIVGSFHWDWNIVNGFNWFVGPAATIGYYTFTNASDYVNFGVGGQIGFEYDFNKLDVPLLVSIDSRPIYDIAGHASGLWWGGALSARYTF